MEQSGLQEQSSLSITRNYYNAAPDKVRRTRTDPEALKHSLGSGQEAWFCFSNLFSHRGDRDHREDQSKAPA